MQTAIRILSDNYPAWGGTKVLDLLCHYPDQPIYATTLERCLNEGISPAEAQSSLYHLAPIRMIDESTLTAVKKRLNQLINVEASSRSLIEETSRSIKPQDEASTHEISALTAYLKESTLPNGAIKCFGDDDTKAYRRIWAAIHRLLKKAEADGHHEAVAIIKHNLIS